MHLYTVFSKGILAVALSRSAISTKVAKQEVVDDAQSLGPLCIIPPSLKSQGRHFLFLETFNINDGARWYTL